MIDWVVDGKLKKLGRCRVFSPGIQPLPKWVWLSIKSQVLQPGFSLTITHPALPINPLFKHFCQLLLQGFAPQVLGNDFASLVDQESGGNGLDLVGLRAGGFPKL